MVLRFRSYRSKYFPQGTLGLVKGNTVGPCTVLGRYVTDLYDVIENWDVLANGVTGDTPLEDIAAVDILIGIAKNYLDHVKMPGATVLAEETQFPMLFTKGASSIIPHGAQRYDHSTVTNAVDYGGELGIIIGKGGLGERKEDVWTHVWGATITNDISSVAISNFTLESL